MKLKELAVFVLVGMAFVLFVALIVFVKLYVHADNRGKDILSPEVAYGVLISIVVAVICVVCVNMFRGK